MKGFFGALGVFLVWSTACIYYVSSNETGIVVPKIESSTAQKEAANTQNTIEKDLQEMTYGNDTVVASTTPIYGDSLQNKDISLVNNTTANAEGKLLADEIMKSFAISDTVDIDRDEPELIFENSIDITSNKAVSSSNFYPLYKGADLIIDKDLVAYANELKQVLNEDPSKKIVIVGHTDNVGNERDNFNIGLKKSRQVKWYLTARRGLLRKNIRAISKGELEPLESNNSNWGRKKNNRIEIIVE